MAHWLEEAERKIHRREKRPSESVRIQEKKFLIQQNYEKNKEVYDGFINKLKELVERVNNLPMEMRDPFGHMDAVEKESKLDNHLVYFSSKVRIRKKTILPKFPFIKFTNFKHIRVIYFCVSKYTGKVEVEVKENFLKKTRKDGHVDDAPKHPHHREEDDQDNMDIIFLWDMEKLDNELAYKIIDWLAFKEELSYLPFKPDDFKYQQISNQHKNEV